MNFLQDNFYRVISPGNSKEVYGFILFPSTPLGVNQAINLNLFLSLNLFVRCY